MRFKFDFGPGSILLPMFVILFFLKVFSVINWSWWVVFMPIFVMVGFFLIGTLLYLLAIVIILTSRK